MSADSFEPHVGQMLPDVALPVAKRGRTISMRSDRGETTVLIWRHPFECDSCNVYLQSLAATADEFRIWDARLVIIGSPSSNSTPAFGIAIANDDSLRLQGVGVLVADRYGQVFQVTQSGNEHAFLSARELVEWLKYLGTLCPE